MLNLDVLGIDKEGNNYLVTYEWSKDLDYSEVIENKAKFIEDYTNIFIANKDNFTVSTLLISVGDEIVFKDVISNIAEFEISPISKGGSVLLSLVDKFICYK